jgi:hypothetical protein
MKKFNITCTFGSVKAPVSVYIGNPEVKHHPLHFQAEWLSKERGGTIPTEIMESLAKLKELSEKNGVPFEELCAYALEAASATIAVEKKETSAVLDKDSSNEASSDNNNTANNINTNNAGNNTENNTGNN